MIDGRLRHELAGHLASFAAADVFVRWHKGETWAGDCITIGKVGGDPLRDIGIKLDPHLIVIGGCVELAEGYSDEVSKY